MYKALIINLPHRADRLAHLETQLPKLKCEYGLVVAIADGSGTCFQSQRKCVEIAKKEGWEKVLILEDDVVFEENVQEVTDKSLSQLEGVEWDMMFLGANLQAPALKYSENLHKMSGAYAAHAYFVHQRFYDTILNLPFDREMDVHYRGLMPDNNVFLCNPMVAYQIPSFSDLQGMVRDYNHEIKSNYATFAEK